MKKIDFGQTMSILANVGVIAGIIFLGVELRQNTSAIRGTTIQAISSQLVESNFIGVDNADLRLAWQHANSDSEQVTSTDVQILSWYYAGSMRIMENRYRQAQFGTIDEETLDQFFGFGNVYGTPYFEQWWETRRGRYPEDFVNWMEREVIPRAQRELVEN